MMENNCVALTLKEVAAFLEERDNYTLLCHAQPDGDTIGSCYSLAYALKQKGKKVRVLCSDPIPPQFTFISNSLVQDDIDNDGTIVALDVADNKLLGKYNEIYGHYNSLSVNIIHN